MFYKLVPQKYFLWHELIKLYGMLYKLAPQEKRERVEK